MNARKLVVAMILMTSIGIMPVMAEQYEFDKVHSTIGFAVKHLAVSTTRGEFKDYTGAIEYDPADLSKFKAEATIQVNSIDTNNADRDKHLINPDFFDSEKFPTITFKSKSLTKVGDAYTLVGDLTIKDVTKEVSIPVEVSGPVQSPYGFSAIGITGEVKINRQDFGIKWSKTLDAGGLMVDDIVKIIVEIEGHTKAEEKK